MLFISSLMRATSRMSPSLSFNLGIEMLFISSFVNRRTDRLYPIVSISESRCFSFQVQCFVRYAIGISVSISESRCFSFQGRAFAFPMPLIPVSISESRCFSFQEAKCSNSATHNNRRFNLGIEMLFISRNRCELRCSADSAVSISESRCFSFQDFVLRTRSYSLIFCFNLGIEMLFVSSVRFISTLLIKQVSFNLGIEMLFVSSGVLKLFR